ncbi:MAG: hydroxyectoine utilization dehydratase EutB [Rhodobacteraceae bacterium]|nr:MAG: hydroxyectoine utilization dehydratase EutB [Paracoccaceae bacterium]
MTTSFVTLAEIEAARDRIAGKVRRTFLNPSPSLSDKTGHPVYLKLEHQQITGSFKLRGATNAVLSLDADDRARGIVAVSTGNHGRALAYAARAAGARAVICMSELVPQAKIDGIKAQGAEIRIVGKSQDEAQHEVDRLMAEDGMVTVPPFDHRDVIAGQGTLGLELLDEVPDMHAVLVQLSGGGLISGVAAAIKALRPEVRIIGVSMERGAAMHASLAAGEPVEVEELPTLADSLGGGIGLDNRLTFAMTRALVDDVVLLTEDEIAAGIRHCYCSDGQIVEGGGAVGVAAVLAGKVRADGPLVLLLSGGNIDLADHRRLICGGTG